MKSDGSIGCPICNCFPCQCQKADSLARTNDLLEELVKNTERIGDALVDIFEVLEREEYERIKREL